MGKRYVCVRSKVFGIGLSKTGTTSLHHALIELGLKSIHYPQRAELFSGDFRCFDDCDAATDIPIVPYYPQLDEAYPGSKFILTVRDVEDWLQSMERWLTPNRRPGEFVLRVRMAVYGVIKFHAGRLRYVYEKHVREVKEYFADRPADLLVMNICAGEGWDKLCPFLNYEPVPRSAFPFVVPGSKKKRLPL
jgi:hypothetical protein